MAKQDYTNVVRGSQEEISARKQILQLFQQRPIPDDELLVNLGLYLRATQVAKVLYLDELYQHIQHLPGSIFEFGVWWGANLALFQSLRSVREPYNWTRKIVGFDTFEGYPQPSAEDGKSKHAAIGGYTVTENYIDYLSLMLRAHEEDNIMGHIQKFDLVKGDVRSTLEEYLARNTQTVIALAYFDLALYEPTLYCLETIRPYLVKGSVLAMDELNSPDFPGETQAVREALGLSKYPMYRSKYLPDRSYMIIE
jgi:hypothetical protein